ncbi:hypothetical protein PR002_g2183 [Phytophthora rubi]|uniref:Uncharacterized protein n=1 Tax=Phytophthora rubi TaxID=129364 RepID=A0A6A3NJD1_9STRA|nr:hypothetical protein PR002_g2183 [Phytophthora rubi]
MEQQAATLSSKVPRTGAHTQTRSVNFLPMPLSSASCGIMVLALVLKYVGIPTRVFKLDTVTVDYVKVLRVRCSWFAMCISSIQKSDDAAASDTGAELVNAFKAIDKGINNH